MAACFCCCGTSPRPVLSYQLTDAEISAKGTALHQRGSRGDIRRFG